MIVRTIFDREGPSGVAEATNRELASYTPRDRGLPYLYCYWEPGEPWAPVERFVIGEAFPRALLVAEHNFMVASGVPEDETRFAELNGPSPRDGAYYDKVLRRLVFRIDGRDPETGQAIEYKPTFTFRQWRFWRELGALVNPVWIVQGEGGGHKRRFSGFDELMLRMVRRHPHAPPPGALPYARPDRRTFEALQKGAELARLTKDFDPEEFTVRLRRHEDSEGRFPLTDAEQLVRREYESWLDNQLDNAMCR